MLELDAMTGAAKTRRLQLFLTTLDERSLLREVNREFPWLTPLEVSGRQLRPVVHLDRQIQVWLPAAPVSEDVYLEPTRAPPLVQFLRCRTFPSRLLEGKSELCQGELGIIYDGDDGSVDSVVRRIWVIAKQMCTSDIVQINPVARTIYGTVHGIFVGPDAVEWARAGNLLASNAANIFYTPIANE
jgi:hypothetical protein